MNRFISAALLLILCLFTIPAFAGTYAPLSCSFADVNAAINNTTPGTGGSPQHLAVDGDIIQLPTGSCTWTSGITVPSNIGITFIGGGNSATPNNTPSTYVPNSTCAQTPSSGGTQITTATGNIILLTLTPQQGNSTTRVSCIDWIASGFTGSSNNMPVALAINGTCTTAGCPQARFDNMQFDGFNGAASGLVNSFAINWTGNVYAVWDHNRLINTIPANLKELTQVSHASFPCPVGTCPAGLGLYGDTSWAQPEFFGSNKFIFFENNTFQDAACCETESQVFSQSALGGARVVVRFNKASFSSDFNALLEWHGTDSGPRSRGPRAFETYGNTLTCTTSSTCNNMHGIRSATGLGFGDTVVFQSGASMNGYFASETQRLAGNQSNWGACDGGNNLEPADASSPFVTGLTISGFQGALHALGTITGGSGYTAGTYSNVALSYVSGSMLGSGATANVTVSGGAVTAVTLTSGIDGTNYQTGDVLTVAAALIGGTGSGFHVPVPNNGVVDPNGLQPIVIVLSDGMGGPSWTNNQWYSATNPYALHDITASTALAGLNEGSSQGSVISGGQSPVGNVTTVNTVKIYYLTQGTPTTFAPAIGDSVSITRATACLDQSFGRGAQATPLDSTVSLPQNLATVAEAAVPAYFWSINFSGGTPNLDMNDSGVTQPYPAWNFIIRNRDWYSENTMQGPQSSATSPFNGGNSGSGAATGMGHGTLANMPTSCTGSSGYAATDQGSWNTSGNTYTDGTNTYTNGVLYKCNGSIFVSYYTPFNYPHPLISNAPQITSQPASQSIVSGNTATMSVTASGGTAPYSYQWYLGESGDPSDPIMGATSSSYTTGTLTLTADLWVSVTDSAGSPATVNSNTATITVTPAICTQPMSHSISSGSTATMSVAGCPYGMTQLQIFPTNNAWNTRVDYLPESRPLDVTNDHAGHPLHPDFGSGTYPTMGGIYIGEPINYVHGNSTPLVAVNITTYSDQSDSLPNGNQTTGFLPIPNPVNIEGDPISSSSWSALNDNHLLLVDEDTNTLHELYNAIRQTDGSITAKQYSHWQLSSNALRQDFWTSTDAAGLAVTPGILKYSEVQACLAADPTGASCNVGHAIRFTLDLTYMPHLWPARHDANSGGPMNPPFGLRVRVKSTFDESSYSATNKVIINTLKTYGAMLADNGGDWFIEGDPNPGWDDSDLSLLSAITPSTDMEVVDVSSWQVSADSGQASPWGTGITTPTYPAGNAVEAIKFTDPAGPVVPSGFTGFSPAVYMTPSPGYGWTSLTGIGSRTRSGGGPLWQQITVINGTGPATAEFDMNLTNGPYTVTLFLGDNDFQNNVGLSVSTYGTQQFYLSAGTAQGQELAQTFNVTVTGGLLPLVFNIPNGQFGAIAGIEIDPPAPAAPIIPAAPSVAATSDIYAHYYTMTFPRYAQFTLGDGTANPTICNKYGNNFGPLTCQGLIDYFDLKNDPEALYDLGGGPIGIDYHRYAINNNGGGLRNPEMAESPGSIAITEDNNVRKVLTWTAQFREAGDIFNAADCCIVMTKTYVFYRHGGAGVGQGAAKIYDRISLNYDGTDGLGPLSITSVNREHQVAWFKAAGEVDVNQTCMAGFCPYTINPWNIIWQTPGVTTNLDYALFAPVAGNSNILGEYVVPNDGVSPSGSFQGREGLSGQPAPGTLYICQTPFIGGCGSQVVSTHPIQVSSMFMEYEQPCASMVQDNYLTGGYRISCEFSVPITMNTNVPVNLTGLTYMGDNGIISTTTAAPYIAEYRSPPTMTGTNASNGTFDPLQGYWAATRSSDPVSLSAAGLLHSPAYLIANWSAGVPSTITINGFTKTLNTDYVAVKQDSTHLLIQYLSDIGENQDVVF